MAEVAHAQMRTEMSLLALSKEMREFKDEMREFKDEMREFKDETEKDRKRMNKAWGDLANKLGTVAEDIVAPNIPRLAQEEFNMGSALDISVRARRASRSGTPREGEYDIVCAGGGKVIVVEVKSSPTVECVRHFSERLIQFSDFYPETEGSQIIGMVASWSVPETVCEAASKAGFYSLAMGDETMHIVARPDGTPAHSK